MGSRFGTFSSTRPFLDTPGCPAISQCPQSSVEQVACSSRPRAGGRGPGRGGVEGRGLVPSSCAWSFSSSFPGSEMGKGAQKSPLIFAGLWEGGPPCKGRLDVPDYIPKGAQYLGRREKSPLCRRKPLGSSAFWCSYPVPGRECPCPAPAPRQVPRVWQPSSG